MKPISLFLRIASSFLVILSTRFPPISRVPEVGRSKVPMMLSRVDFPLPDCPTIEQKLPLVKLRSMSVRARVIASRSP